MRAAIIRQPDEVPGGIKRLHFRRFDRKPLVAVSTDYYSAGPLIACCGRRWWIVMIVKSARLRDHEIAGLATLSRRQYTD